MKQLIALTLLLTFASLELVDCAVLSLGNELGIELVEVEPDNSEKESEGEKYEQQQDEKLVFSYRMEFSSALQTQKHELDRMLMKREIFREIISPPPELT